MKAAETKDLPRVKTFLEKYITTSMFPLSNLEKFGTSGHDLAVQFWLHEAADEITDVLTITQAGMVFPQIHSMPMTALSEVLDNKTIIGIIGQAQQVSDLRAAFAKGTPTKLDAVEPHFSLTIDDMQMPDTHGMTLEPLESADRDLMIAWRRDYEIEALNENPIDALKIATDDVDRYIVRDSHRVLYHNGTPVCTTGFNATYQTCVQIGGVYTPPEQRNKGYARAAVALHLKEAQAKGADTAILFSASEAAARAYMSIGFRQIGEFTLMIFDEPTVIHV